MADFLGPAIAAGGQLIGGIVNAFQGDVAAGRAQDVANNQQSLQREFGTTGITWRARDAVRAAKETGIHPLSLLGVQGPTYSPVNLSMESNTHLGNAIANAGQGIGRAIAATETEEQRAFRGLQLERVGLENDLLRARIDSERALQQRVGPGMPISSPASMPGQGDVKTMDTTRLVNIDPQINHQDLKPSTDISWVRTPSGGYTVMPGKDVKQLMEDSPYEYVHLYRTMMNAMVGRIKPPFKNAPGMEWSFDPGMVEWREVPRRSFWQGLSEKTRGLGLY